MPSKNIWSSNTRIYLYIKNKYPLSLSCKNQVAGDRSSFTLCEKLKCLRESELQYSKHAVSVYSKKTNQRMKFIRYISDTMAKVVDVLMSNWKVIQVIEKVIGNIEVQYREHGCNRGSNRGAIEGAIEVQ